MNTSKSRSCCSGDCCTDAAAEAVAPAATAVEADTVREKVREGYAAIAKAACGCGSGGGGCCGGVDGASLAEAIGYSKAELAGTPEGANMGLSCGNPTAIASLKPGEVVLDLGSGGGFDAFIAGPKVGATGRVIGVDMTPDMISKARRNIAGYREHSGLSNVEFRLGEIENLPVADSSVDVVISNCVLNLSPEKGRVWREIGRVLKPGGRVAVSDLALLKPLPAAVAGMLEALVGCIAGAVQVGETRRMMHEAGLTDIQLTPKPQYIRSLEQAAGPAVQEGHCGLPAGTTVADYITSLDIAGVKPAR